jgi:predicted MFS family arabinose efflux permease
MSRLAVLSPLRYRDFRWLWVGMGASYAGDRLQELAQAWLVASLTGSSALAVGAIGVTAAVPQLLMPLGGALADQLNRRRLLIATQLAGALAAVIVGALVVAERIAPWHIYAWAFFNGALWMLARPGYKVLLTESVPVEEVRPAVAINSITETLLIVVIAAAGSLLLDRLGLALGFGLNAFSYLFAALCLWWVPRLGEIQERRTQTNFLRRLPGNLWAGFVYLWQEQRLLKPMLLTFSMVMLTTPMFGLLAAVVQAQGGTIFNLGMLSAASGLGAFIGALTAGWRSEGSQPIRLYAILGLVAAAALAGFAWLPLSFFSALPLALVGGVLFSQAVWNTSRIRLLANVAYQARLQALTSMSFTLAGASGQAWGGFAIDHFGLPSLFVAAALLAAISLLSLLPAAQPAGNPGRFQ